MISYGVFEKIVPYMKVDLILLFNSIVLQIMETQAIASVPVIDTDRSNTVLL